MFVQSFTSLHDVCAHICVTESLSSILLRPSTIYIFCERNYILYFLLDIYICFICVIYFTNCLVCLRRYDENGHCQGAVSKRELRPIRLQWDIPSECIDVAESSLRVAQAIASDVDLHIQVSVQVFIFEMAFAANMCHFSILFPIKNFSSVKPKYFVICVKYNIA